MFLTNDALFTFRAGARLATMSCRYLSNPKALSPSNSAINLMLEYEKFSSKPYDDQTGKQITSLVPGATIGYGHLITSAGEFSKYKNGISKSTAKLLFEKDIYKFIEAVRNNVEVKLTQNEFDALVLFSFNIGVKGLADSTVLEIINWKSTKNLQSEWGSYIHSQGRVMKGLINRRKSELDIFYRGIYTR